MGLFWVFFPYGLVVVLVLVPRKYTIVVFLYLPSRTYLEKYAECGLVDGKFSTVHFLIPSNLQLNVLQHF